MADFGVGEAMMLAAAAASAAGATMQQSAAEDAAKKQQDIINRAAEENDALNAKREQTTQQFVKDNFDPVNREQRLDDTAKANEISLVDALMKANGGSAGEVKSAAEGNLSSDYTRAAGTATAVAADDILKRARLMSRINAPSLMYGQEALSGGQLSSDLAGLNSSANRTNNYANMLLNRAQNRGSLAGGLLTGLGSAGMSVGASNIGAAPSPGLTGDNKYGVMFRGG